LAGLDQQRVPVTTPTCRAALGDRQCRVALAPMTRVVRKGHGLQLENDSTQLQLKDIKPALDTWAQDARLFKP
jgi:hypothetical protein